MVVYFLYMFSISKPNVFSMCVGVPATLLWADSLKDDWSPSGRPKLVFDKRDLSQTNEQKRHLNE